MSHLIGQHTAGRMHEPMPSYATEESCIRARERERAIGDESRKHRLVMIGLAYAGRDTPEGPPRSSPVLSPKLPFPVGRCDGEYTVYSSGANWWNLHMSHGPCTVIIGMKGDYVECAHYGRRRSARRAPPRRAINAAPRPWRRWGGARYNAQHVFSRFR